ncbi:hypothetical protein Taro_049354 [Colocasia esculenta]|uniref:Serine/threonine protein phosphatase 2A regulatory subunit n=1 Tax=Colocasia esculenta TaxID=4460 RepID=A0A843XAU8_COLES|nr:hypothetical protein [Colocasia esculenta]
MGAPREAPKGPPTKKSTTLKHLFDLDLEHTGDGRLHTDGAKVSSSSSREAETEELLCTISYCTRVVFTFADPGESSLRQDLKRLKLSRILSIVHSARGAWPDGILSSLVSMLSANLFRPLPPPAYNPLDFPDEEIPAMAFAPAWPHLNLAYDVLGALVASCEPRALRGFLDQEFLSVLLSLFQSGDPRERERLKGVYHQIYARLAFHRKFMRKSMADELLRFVFDGESHCGIGELLEVWGSIITGLTVPLKEEHRVFLARVLIPLHRPKGMHLYHKQLAYCVCQFVMKEQELGGTVVKGILRCWPSTNCQKEVLLIGELEALAESMGENQFAKLALPLCSQIARSSTSCNSQVAERALYAWNNEQFVRMASQSMAEVLPPVVQGIERNLRSHWSRSVRELTVSVKKMLEEREPALYAQCLGDFNRRESMSREEEMKRKAKWDTLEVAVAKL